MTDRSRTRVTDRLRPLVAAVLVGCLVVGAAIPAAGLLADSSTADTAATDGAATDGVATAENAASADATQVGESGGNESDANVTASAGARLAGAIGTQQSETAGELETRTLVVRLGRADSPEERAAVLAVLEARADARLASLRERRERLRAAADNRSISAGAYAYLAATVSVEAAVNRRLADRGERATDDLPAAVTAEYGLSTERFRALANRSNSVTVELRSDLRALGRSLVADEDEAIDGDDEIEAEDILDSLNETVAPTNRTDWPFDGNDSTLGDALDDLGEDNESLDLGDVVADDANDSDGLLDGNRTDGNDSRAGDTDGSDADGSDDPFGGNLDGNVSDEDGLIDGTDGSTETPTDESAGNDGFFEDDTATAEEETTDETTDGGLFDG